MRNKTWNFRIDDESHTLELQHSTSGLKTKVWHNNQLLLEHGDMTTMTYSADFPFDINGHEVVIHIRPGTIRSRYHLSIDGEPAPGETLPETTPPIDKYRLKVSSAIFTLFIGAPLLVFFVGDDWQVAGIRADYVGYGLFVLAACSLIYLYFNRPPSDEVR